jgi:hypothetical protein
MSDAWCAGEGAAGVSKPAIGENRPCVFRCDGIRIAVASDDPSAVTWLEEFLTPSFEVVDTQADWSIKLSFDRQRFAALEASGPAGGLAEAFAMDSHTYEVRRWRSLDGGTALFDERFQVFYLLDSSQRTAEVLGRRTRRKARLPLMRVVRELAMNAVMEGDGICLHASGFVLGGRAAIVTGPKNSGKTTVLVHALHTEGVQALANDRVVVDWGRDGEPIAWAMPSVVMLRPGTLASFSGLRDRLQVSALASEKTAEEAVTESAPALPRDDGRYAVSPAQLWSLLGATPSSKATVASLVFPSVTQAAGGIDCRRIDPEDAARRLRASLFGAGTLRSSNPVFVPAEFRPASEGVLADRCRTLVAGVRCYQMRLGTEAYARPGLTSNLVAEIFGD